MVYDRKRKEEWEVGNLFHQNQRFNPIGPMHIDNDNGQIESMYTGGGTVRKIKIHPKQTVSIWAIFPWEGMDEAGSLCKDPVRKIGGWSFP